MGQTNDSKIEIWNKKGVELSNRIRINESYRKLMTILNIAIVL